MIADSVLLSSHISLVCLNNIMQLLLLAFELFSSFFCFSCFTGFHMWFYNSLLYIWSLINQVVIPLHQLKAVNPSLSQSNTSEKYIQVISVDNHEFWFMGFLNYEGAINCLREASQTGHQQTVWELNSFWTRFLFDLGPG